LEAVQVDSGGGGGGQLAVDHAFSRTWAGVV
jgi:hypothetical protein